MVATDTSSVVALGAALFTYETRLKADKFLVLAHDPAAEVAHAKEILATFHPAQVDLNHAVAAA
jgi:hypothetical protein